MQYKEEQFTLNILCEFRNRTVESEFMEYEKAESLGTVRLLMLIMGAAFASFAVSDYFFLKGSGAFFISLGLRITAFLITAAIFFRVGKLNRYGHILITVTLAELSVFALYLVNLYNIKNHQPDLQFMTMILFVLAVSIIPNKWKYSLGTGFIIVTGYTVFCAVTKAPMEAPSLAVRAVYLGISFICCGLSAFTKEKSRRRQFAAEKLLEFRSVTDKLTGIYNRAHFEAILGQWIKNKRHNPFCLLFFDIDDFKKVNDRYGHTMGDKVLVETVEIVSANIRDEDVFARWGGEEFVVLFSGISIGDAAVLAGRIRNAVETNPAAKAERVTISIGVVQYRQGETSMDLVNRSDRMMYMAKKAGKNRVVAEEVEAAASP